MTNIREINEDLAPKLDEINDMIVVSRNCFLEKTQKIYNLFLSVETYLPTLLKYEQLRCMIFLKSFVMCIRVEKMYMDYNKERRFSPDEKRFIREFKRLLLEIHHKCK